MAATAAVAAAGSKTERKSASESRFESHGVVIACRAIARLRGMCEGCRAVHGGENRQLLERGEG